MRSCVSRLFIEKLRIAWRNKKILMKKVTDCIFNDTMHKTVCSQIVKIQEK